MKISKRDGRAWFEFFACMPEGEELLPSQQEIVYSVLAQIEDAVDARNQQLMDEIPELKTVEGRTFYIGPDKKFSKGCRSCLTGTGLSAIRKTNRCNANCKFCYDYGVLDCQPAVGEGLWEIGGTRFRERDLDLLLSVSNRPTGVSYVYLEPFMEIEKYYGVIRKFHEAGIHQHMYTNGILVGEENLKALRVAGLDELRFNLGATHCSDRVIEHMAMAKKYIPSVGIETPMTPEFNREFREMKDRILATGIDFMNLAELHLNPNNIGNYMGEPLYSCRVGYISPQWSRELSLKLMAEAAREDWGIVVHDCSNHTKFARDLNLRAKEGGWFGASAYASEFDAFPFEAFLPSLSEEALPFLEEEPLPEYYRPGALFF